MTEPFDYERILAACTRHDQQALRALYDRDGGWLLSVASRIVGDPQLAEDVLQDAFVQIWTRAETFDPTLGSARGWIYTIVRHRALQEVRRPGFVRQVNTDNIEALQDMVQVASQSGQSDGNADSGWAERQALLRCMKGLSPEARYCIESAYLEGYTQQELADRLSKPLGTVKSWIRRGLKALKDCLA